MSADSRVRERPSGALAKLFASAAEFALANLRSEVSPDRLLMASMHHAIALMFMGESPPASGDDLQRFERMTEDELAGVGFSARDLVGHLIRLKDKVSPWDQR